MGKVKIPVYVREPEYGLESDYRYLAEATHPDSAAHIWITSGSDNSAQEAFDHLFSGLEKLGLASSLNDLEIDDATESLQADPDPETPKKGDWVLAPTGPLGSNTTLSQYEMGHIATFNHDAEAYAAAKMLMKEQQFYPNV